MRIGRYFGGIAFLPAGAGRCALAGNVQVYVCNHTIDSVSRMISHKLE